MGFVLRLHESFVQAGNALLESFLRSDELFRSSGFRLCGRRVHRTALAEHSLFNLLSNDRAYTAEILADGVDLKDGTHQVFVISYDISGFRGFYGGDGREPLPHWVPDEDLVLLLTMAVDTAIALFHDVRIPRNLDVNEEVTVILQVDTFGGGIGRQQDADGRDARVGLECRLHGFAFVGLHASVQVQQTIATVSVCGQDLVEPCMSRSVFGEQNPALSVPLAIRLEVVFEPVENRLRLRVDPIPGFFRPPR